MANRIRELLRNTSVLYTLMSIVASGINVLTLIVFGRVFSVEDYAVVTTMQAMVANVAIFMTPLQNMICKEIAVNSDSRQHRINNLVSILFAINALEAVVMVLAAVPMMRYLHFTGVVEYVLFLALVFSNNIYIVVNGVAQGKQDFLLLGWAGLALYGIKMILGVALGLAGIGPVAVTIGFTAAEVFCLILFWRKLAAMFGDLRSGFRLGFDGGEVKDYLWISSLYMVVSLYMNNGDLLLSNLYCSKAEIGLYSVAITLAKISVFLIATPLATLLLPKVAQHRDDAAQQKKLLAFSELMTAGLSVLCGLALCLVGRPLILLLYGEAYADSARFILPCVVFSTLLGVFWVFYQYALAVDMVRKFAVTTIGFGLAAVLCIVLMKLSLQWIPLVMAVAMLATMLFVVCDGGKRTEGRAEGTP